MLDGSMTFRLYKFLGQIGKITTNLKIAGSYFKYKKEKYFFNSSIISNFIIKNWITFFLISHDVI